MKLLAEDSGDGAGGGTSTTLGDAGKTETKATGGETTLSKAAGTETKTETKAAETKPADGEKKPDAKAGEKPAPVDYEKWAPKEVEGLKRPESGVKTFREAGKKLALSPEQMQGLVDFDDARTKQLAAEFRAERAQQQKDWLESLKNDKELGGAKWSETTADLERVLKKYGDDPELREWFNETGDGDRPALVRLFARIGKSMREDSVVGGPKNTGAGAKKPTLIEQLYGSPPAANAKS